MKNKRNFKTSILDDECFPISLQTFRVKNRSCIRLFVNSFVFSSKLVIFIEKEDHLDLLFSCLFLQETYLSKIDCLKSSVARR